MANKKFSEFELKTTTSDVSHVVGYNGAENVQITPANFVTTGGTGVFLPLAGGTMVGNTTHNDNVKSIFGSPGNDLEIYHDGSDSYINDLGTGDLKISGSSILMLKPGFGEFLAKFVPDGAVELYYDSSKKLETTSTGISVTGGGAFTGDVTADSFNTSNGSLSQSGFWGTRINAGTGSTADFALLDSSTNGIMYNPTGTLNMVFAGNITLGSGEYLSWGTSGQTAIEGSTVSNLMKFYTNSSEKMRLDASGNLGLGTSAPASKLDVSAASGDGLLVSNSTSAAYNAGLIVNFNDVSTMQLTCLGTSILQAGNTGNTVLASRTNKDIIITPNGTGNVGVGTSSPAYKIDVKKTDASGNYAYFGASSDGGARGLVLSSADNGIFLGAIHDFDASSGSGQLTFSIGGTEKMRLDASGNLTIGSTTNAGYKLKVEGSGTVQLNNRLVNDGAVFAAAHQGTVVGTISVTASATAYNTTSDYRLKEDLQDFEGLDLVSKIPVYDYKWKADESRSYGVMAHELEEVLPQAVSGEKDAEEMQSVDYSKIVPLLIKSIQELTAKVEKLELNK